MAAVPTRVVVSGTVPENSVKYCTLMRFTCPVVSPRAAALVMDGIGRPWPWMASRPTTRSVAGAHGVLTVATKLYAKRVARGGVPRAATWSRRIPLPMLVGWGRNRRRSVERLRAS